MAGIIKILLLTLAVATVANSAPSPTVPSCGQPADVVFMVDSSSSIWPYDFKTFVLPFIKNVSSVFDIGPGPRQTRIGALTFSTGVRLEFDLKDHQSKEGLMSAIDGIASRGGSTYTDKALKFVDRHMFTAKAGARPDVPHIIIVLTDGDSSNHRRTVRQAERARSNGATIFAVGVGDVDDRELELIASSPAERFKFKVTEFSSLDRIMVDLAIKTCGVSLTTTTTTTTTTPTTTTPTTTTTTPTTTTTTTTTEDPMNDCGGKPADIFFVVDSSSSIRQVDFEKRVLGFLRDVIKGFSIGKDKTRVGVMTFSDTPRLVIGLDDYVTKKSLLAAVTPRVVRYTLGKTNTAAAIRDVRKYGFHETVKRGSDVARIAVVITDGKSWDEVETKEQAQKLRDTGVTVYAIGVGKEVKEVELESIANSPMENFVFSVDDFAALSELRGALAAKTCAGDDEMPLSQPQCGNGPIEMTFAFDASSTSNSGKLQVVENIESISKRLATLAGDVKIGVSSGPCPPSLDVSMSIPEVSGLKLRRAKKHIRPRLHSIVKAWRREQRMKDAKFNLVVESKLKNVLSDYPVDDLYVDERVPTRGLVLLLNRENVSEFEYLAEEVSRLLEHGTQVFAVIDESVGKYHVDKWVDLLGPSRVLGGVRGDHDYSGQVMEFMCAL